MPPPHTPRRCFRVATMAANRSCGYNFSVHPACSVNHCVSAQYRG